MRTAPLAALGVTMTIGTLGCPSLSPFACEDDAHCDRAPGGVCVGQDCAYPDAECPGTMLRYSPNAPHVGGVCVPPDHSDEGSSTMVVASTGSESSTGGIAGCGTTRTLSLDPALLGSTSLPGYAAPVVIAAEAGLADLAADDASDVWFAAEDGTVLPHELDTWDPTTGALAAWVRLPGWRPGVPLAIVLHAGDPGSTPTPDPTAVWDDTFEGVWHFGDPLADGEMDLVRDSTLAGHHGYAVGDMGPEQQVTGVIGGALQFDGVDDEVQITAAFVGALESFTISTWIRIDGDDSVAQPLFQQLNGTLFPRCRRLDAEAGSNLFCQLELEDEDVLAQVGAAETVLQDGELRHVALTYDATLGEARLFVDGEQVDTSTATMPTVPVPGPDRFGLGRIDEFGSLNGMLDEVRVSLRALEPARIAADHRVQRTPDALVAQLGPATPWPCP